MKKNGFIIRFIDIGLIILFGFLSISDINNDSQIRLPGSEQENTTDLEKKVMVTISIDRAGFFNVAELETEYFRTGIRTKRQLEIVLHEIQTMIREAGKEILVMIFPDPASRIQATVDALDACDKYKILKNINTDNQSLML